MFYKGVQIMYCLFLIHLEMGHLVTRKNSATSINNAATANSMTSRFLDFTKGFENFAPTRLDSLGSNYPPAPPFFPFGNQKLGSLQPSPEYKWDLQNQYRYQEMDQKPLQEQFRHSPFPRILSDRINHYGSKRNVAYTPSFNIADTPFIADDVSSIISNNRPYENSLINHELNSQIVESHPNDLDPHLSYYDKFPIQDVYNPNPKLYPSPVYDNMPVEPFTNAQQTEMPHNIGSIPHNSWDPNVHATPLTNIMYPLDATNTRNPQTNQRELNKLSPGSLNRIPTNPSVVNNEVVANINKPGDFKHTAIHAEFNDVRQNLPRSENQNKQDDTATVDSDDKVAILGKPVIVPTESLESNDVDFESLRMAAQKQCVQDCDTSSEYNPVCGTDNVTYINPSKYVCARKCGVDVQVSRQGRCTY